MTGRTVSFDGLREMAAAAFELIRASVRNDDLELYAAMIEEAAARAAATGGAALLISDLKALVFEYQAVADAEANARERRLWMAARGVQEGGK